MKYQVIFGYEYQMENPRQHIFDHKNEAFDFVEEYLKEKHYPAYSAEFYQAMHELVEDFIIYRPDGGTIAKIKEIDD